MSARPIYKNTTYMLTRRTTQRLYLMRPSQEVNAYIRYCVAIAQRRSGIKIHSLVFMSNHYHMAVTDEEGTLPIFTEEKMCPRVACKDKWLRIKMLLNLKAFEEAYKPSQKRFSGGDHSVEFPLGTYRMPRFYGARCAEE